MSLMNERERAKEEWAQAQALTSFDVDVEYDRLATFTVTVECEAFDPMIDSTYWEFVHQFKFVLGAYKLSEKVNEAWEDMLHKSNVIGKSEKEFLWSAILEGIDYAIRGLKG